VAKSDAQARMMAEEMIGVEENVQKRFDEEHTKAQQFLSTAKNLGTAGTIKQQPKQEPVRQMPPKQDGVLIRPLDRPQVSEPKSRAEEVAAPKIGPAKIEPVYTDTNFGNKNLKDLMFDQIKNDNHEIKNIEELKPDIRSVPDIRSDITPDLTPDIPQEIKTGPGPIVDQAPEIKAESPKLDSQKLVELMEEDGKLEEHTREIKEKPKVIKPKEEYAENNIDLSAMFNVHK